MPPPPSPRFNDSHDSAHDVWWPVCSWVGVPRGGGAPNASRRCSAVPRGLSSASLTNLRMRLCTRSLTTPRERSTRRTCRPWLRPPPRTAQRSTSFPSQRSPCPSPNNLADPVRTRRRRLPLCETHFYVSPLTPAKEDLDLLYVKAVGPLHSDLGLHIYAGTKSLLFPPSLHLHSGTLVIRAKQERRRSDIVSLQQNASLHESLPVSAALRCQKGGETALSFQGCRLPLVIGRRRLEDAANRRLPSRPPWLRLCDWPRCCRARNGRQYWALLASGSIAASAHSSSSLRRGERNIS